MTIRRVLASNVGGKSQIIDDTSGISNAFEHVLPRMKTSC